ncbi:cyclin-dependent kinase 11B-like [Sphaerodactylus townsendi]|uniref:cyclin-dependent kinase 11B-like n=1 Tax=Sphaerodactylus townsendi TaxID=933632 RepID=UPI0020267952|nr:cyclin-dependent kinase 11B-like [Sphaerodactylus townsendi]
MGDEKGSWKVKTLDEILQKKRRKEQEEKADIKRLKNSDDRDSKRDSLEEGELRDHRMEITIRNPPYRREYSMEARGEEDDSLAIKPPQQMLRKEKAHHRKDEKRKEKRRHRSHSAEGKHVRVKEKEREHKHKKRHREEQDKARREAEEEKEEVAKASLQSMTEGNNILYSPVELKQELPKYLPAHQGCRSVEEFQCLNRIEEGTYGVVYRAKDKKTDEIVALKRLKMEKEKEGFPITSLREINTILKAQHPNIVTVREIVVGSNMDKIYIVMNYVEHDLKSLMETMKQPFLPGEVKTLMIQLLRGVEHLHDNWILHRDLKTSNLLLSHAGILKVGDFGLAHEYGSPLKPYTPVVVTLWYRAPELLLGAKEYSTAIDMWSVGCIFGELLTQKPLFPGESEIDQINKVFKDLGTPSEKIWPGYNELPAVKKMTFTEYPYNNLRKRFGALLSDQGFDLMNKFLTYYPGKRINAEDGLKHEYFQETPLPIDPSMFPTWLAKSEQQRVKRGTSPRLPEGGLGYSQLGDDDLKDTGFHLTTTNQGASAAGPGFSLKF